MFFTAACLWILLNASKFVVSMAYILRWHYRTAKQVQAIKAISSRDDRLFNGNVIEPLFKFLLGRIDFPEVSLNNQAQNMAQLIAKASDRIKLALEQAIFDRASWVPWIVEATGLRRVV